MSPRIVNLHWKVPYDVYVGRGRDPRTMIESPWGNPFTHLPGKTLAQFIAASREDAILKHRQWFADQVGLHQLLPQLYGKILGCWCAPAACHATTLAEAAEIYVEKPGNEWREYLNSLRYPEVAQQIIGHQSNLWT
jgi:hypothetical protein